jgi:ABC-type polysaccharide/polyol phosphate export permease
MLIDTLMTRKIILIILILIGFYYCFRFGYIWTAYGHGGQLLGVPFALIMLIATIIYFAQKSQSSKNKAFIFCIVYFLTLAAFSLTIEIIRATVKNYFEFLYYEPGGYVNKIFLGWLLLGALTLFVSFKYSNKFINDRAI